VERLDWNERQAELMAIAAEVLNPILEKGLSHYEADAVLHMAKEQLDHHVVGKSTDSFSKCGQL
jgi:hypothetical protein